MVGGTTGTSDTSQNHATLVGRHAFTILGAYTFTDGAASHNLIKIRNPWGSERYTGPWSDASSLWTPELMRQAKESQPGGYTNDKGDGLFFMDPETFKAGFFGVAQTIGSYAGLAQEEAQVDAQGFSSTVEYN